MHPDAYLRITILGRPLYCLNIEERNTFGEYPFDLANFPEHKYGHHQKSRYNQLQYIHHGV